MLNSKDKVKPVKHYFNPNKQKLTYVNKNSN